jgi:hypothetical protein
MPVVRFMPDGKSVLVSNPNPNVDVARFSLATGQPIATLTCLGKWIKQMRITCQGTAYLCSDDATVTAWDATSGAILKQFKVGAKP